MATYTKGPPCAEGVIPMPERSDQFPLVSQVLFMPWEITTAIGDQPSIDALQVMVVPRDEWERLQQQRGAE